MNAVIPEGVRNFVLLGEAGCGKSELAINLSRELVESGLPVHLFDLDMTKPLLRTREQAGPIEQLGIELHFEEQYADAPTTTGGVQRLLRDDGCYTVLDVGGDHIGARAVGGYAPQLNRDSTRIWYLEEPAHSVRIHRRILRFRLSWIAGLWNIHRFQAEARPLQ